MSKNNNQWVMTGRTYDRSVLLGSLLTRLERAYAATPAKPLSAGERS